MIGTPRNARVFGTSGALTRRDGLDPLPSATPTEAVAENVAPEERQPEVRNLTALPIADGWRSVHSYLLLAACTLLCLIPFSGRAFHIDDTLFVWAAKNIAQNPANPYSFRLIWETTTVPMSDVTQNPPLASYYAALLGSVMGWSERVLHLGFLLPTLALVLGTYRLAQRFTSSPLLAAFATLLTPGLLISASSVMCDTMMLALWVWAAIFWIEGLDSSKSHFLAASAMLMACAALTKYFGAALILLLFAYSIVRQRKLGSWAAYLLLPIAALFAYQMWTKDLYGHGLLLGAADYAASQRGVNQVPIQAKMLLGISFTGGCALTGLFLGALLLPRKQVVGGILFGGLASALLIVGRIDLGDHVSAELASAAWRQHWLLAGTQLTLCIAGGLFVFFLMITDLWQKGNPESLFLALWIAGTAVFAALLNWTLNARSILPLIPAVGILLARRFDEACESPRRFVNAGIVVALVISAGASVWLAAADAELANSARTAAIQISEKWRSPGRSLRFCGHWGFQYYMESLGARPVDFNQPNLGPGDSVVIPYNNTHVCAIEDKYIAGTTVVEVPIRSRASTVSWELGAGFYDSFWGPMPFAVGPAPSERYAIVQISPTIVWGNQ